MNIFFWEIMAPSLSEMDREELNMPITLEEIQWVTNKMAGGKSPGPDGLPVEIYQHYREGAAPRAAEGFKLVGDKGRAPHFYHGIQYNSNS